MNVNIYGTDKSVQQIFFIMNNPYKILLILLLCGLYIQESRAQMQGELNGLEVDESTVVHSLKRQYLSYYRNTEKITGWRLLLFSTSDRRVLDKNLRKFNRHFNGVPNEWTYEQPYYKFKVGAYMTKLEAKNEIQKYQEDFPGAIEIRDKIEKEDFLK